MPLPAPHTQTGRAGLAEIVDHPRDCLAGFDFDGTLAPLVLDPETSSIPATTKASVVELAGYVRRVVVITGRPAAQAVDLGRLADIPGVIVEGQYGAQRWEGGTLIEPPEPPGVDALRRALPGILAGSDPAIWVEDKGLGLVVHTRRSADPVGELARLRPRLMAAAAEHGLHAEDGRMVVEMRAPGPDKGEAVRRLRAETGARSVLFAGDDIGDVPAFEAVERLRRDGVPGLTVCAASGDVPELEERADLVLDGPAGVAVFLAELVAALRPT
ncbi:MAG: trehalose-phosphatase [Mycobacteriales bacterium]